ncbi:SusC/RagA family TonB-linked outer membrane protein [Niabella aurantiaca]|uniref:SusC/RagA family TonB-linked outer membrane protein n=1 Tax=Niabella aurantiaca TaxID=379900 RepID=UPI00036FCE0D|nr:TonB-dependent receptor [Niabella aurantiaca]
MRLIWVFLLVFSSTVGYAQTKSISGVVKNAEDGVVLGGVTVSIANKSLQTTTDQNGEFKIDALVGDTLVFSFVGKKEQKEVVGTKSILQVQMYNDKNDMEEVTVVAFGKQKKATVVGAITTVSAKDLRIPASNLTSAFAGRIPGVISYQLSGEPGADNAQFFVRGVTTFGYQAAPLVLIDGFESTMDNLARMQPDDIETFSIMKDALATGMYGARGANGIIMVTTKAGHEGPVGFNVRFDVNVASPVRTPKMLDGPTYMKLYNEARITRDPNLGPYYSQQKIQSTIDNENPMIFPNIDWYKTMFKPSATNMKANVNISGGGQVATYYVSMGMDKEEGRLRTDQTNKYSNNIDIQRYFIRSNVVFKLTPTTKLDTRIQGRFEGLNGPYVSASNLFRMVMFSNPVDFPAVYEPDSANQFTQHVLFGSSFVNGATKVNPYAEMVRGYQDKNTSDITAQATLMQDLGMIVKGLRAQLKASATTWSENTGLRAYNPYYYDLESYNQITGVYKLFPLNSTSGQPYLGNIIPVRDANGRYYYELLFNWERTFGPHSLAATTVGTMEKNLLTSGSSTSIFEALPEKNVRNSGRANYTYDRRYMMEFGYSYMGSEKFTGGKRWGFFPSVGAGWSVSNEKFWEPLKDVVSTLKLRGSWGLVGNDNIAARRDRFFFLSDITLFNGATVVDNGYRWGTSFMNSYGGFRVNRYANPDITWEESEKWNLGIDLNLFNEALKLQTDFYQDRRSKIYMRRENFPASAGLEAAISGNVGEVLSKGFESSLSYEKTMSKDFWFSARANLTYATNKLVRLDERNYPDQYLKRLGSNINQQWGLIAERLFVDEYEIQNSPKQDFGDYLAGDIKYKDVNGDGIINGNDRVAIGYPTVPEIQYGFGASMMYKMFDLGFFFNGSARTSFFIDATAASSEDRAGIAPFAFRRNALAIIADDYWSETDPNVHAFWPRLSTFPVDNNIQQSSWWVRDGSFLKLQSVELGYSLRQLKRWGIKGDSRIYVSGQNLFTFSSFKLWDPEMRDRGLGYPNNKRINVGIQLTF